MLAHPSQPTLDDRVDLLLVEDNPGDVRLVREAFAATERETSVEAVTTGTDAVDLLTRQADDDELPDVVLLDLNLPRMNGCDVLETIRDDPRLRFLPVIILTSSRDEEDVARCYDARANAYLTKPDETAELFSLAETIEQFWLDQARLPPVPA